MNIVIFGLGFSAEAFVTFAKGRFASVVGTVTTHDKASRLTSTLCPCYIFNDQEADPKIIDALQNADAVLVSIGPDDEGDPVLRHYAKTIAASPSIRWIGYLSTIGVYGDAQGGWVDETTPPNPSHVRTMIRVDVEKAWLDLGIKTNKPVHIFRLAGIYGPGRNPILNLKQRPQRIIKPGQVFNRIHVDDIAQTLLASLAAPRAGAIYNVTDHEPAPPQDVMTYAARLIGVEPPPEIPFEQAVMSEMARSFYADNKRVSNRLIRDELGVTLLFPTYREGLDALVMKK